MNKKIFDVMKTTKVKKLVPFDFSGTTFGVTGPYIANFVHDSTYVAMYCYSSTNANANVRLQVDFPEPIGSPMQLWLEFEGQINGYMHNTILDFYYIDGSYESLYIGTVNLGVSLPISTKTKHNKIHAMVCTSRYYNNSGGQSAYAGVELIPMKQTKWV